MKSDNLFITIYLNQKIVFDLLAILEDGFSQFSTINTSTSNASKSNGEISGEIGVSNIFALLGVKLKSALKSEDSESEQSSLKADKIHTPTSLFAKLHSEIANRGMIKYVSNSEDLNQIVPGDFVEFKGILEKNPLINMLDSFQRFGEMASLFEEEPIQQKGNKQQGQIKPSKNSENTKVISQIKALSESLKVGNMLDLICTVDNSNNLRIVTPVSVDYFFNQNMNEVIDGQYKVFGKVIRVVPEYSDESINLLRNTSFSLFQNSLLSGIFGNFKDLEEAGLKLPSLDIEIEGPSLLIIPIAIFS
ncbi:MAG: hypothetical protein JWM44_3788 [Bacilli bacterium]|nr:hypothetical protein [Bacilli bacterium]